MPLRDHFHAPQSDEMTWESFWGIDDGQVYGSRRFHAHTGAALVVHLALATVLAQAERYEGTYGKMKLSPISQTLRKLMKALVVTATEDDQARRFAAFTSGENSSTSFTDATLGRGNGPRSGDQSAESAERGRS
jgi:hypothetical protein